MAGRRMSRAVVYETLGGPEVLKIIELPDPELAHGEVVVAVRAVGLNPFDSKARSGQAPVPVPLPRGIGTDFAGAVSRVTDAATYADGTLVSIGDEVMGWGFGSLREQFDVPAALLGAKHTKEYECSPHSKPECQTNHAARVRWSSPQLRLSHWPWFSPHVRELRASRRPSLPQAGCRQVDAGDNMIVPAADSSHQREHVPGGHLI